MSAAELIPFDPPSRLTPFTLADLLRMDLPPRETILSPWLPTKGLAMLYAPRGVGKTHIGLGVAYSAASGGRFLRWNAPKPRKVLVVDGEMPKVALQERAAALVAAFDQAPPGEDFFRMIAADHEEDGIPDLATVEGQKALSRVMGDAELIVLDNISTLCRSGRENEGESWGSVQEFALRLRREGRTVLFIHHAGKGGAQRGTSRREDVLDTVVKLSRPEGYQPSEGARFVVEFEKARGFTGKDADPFEASLDPATGEWSTRDLEDVRETQIRTLFADGVTVFSDIAKELNVSKSTVTRAVQRMKEAGRWNE